MGHRMCESALRRGHALVTFSINDFLFFKMMGLATCLCHITICVPLGGSSPSVSLLALIKWPATPVPQGCKG